MMSLGEAATAATEDVAMTTTKPSLRPCIVVIGGPTGSGKTDLAIRLARETGASIVSADSRQIYREMPIGSAAPTAGQLQGAPHYLVGSHSIHDTFNAGVFALEASVLLQNLTQENPIQIVCGGSGLYINALLNGMDDLPEIPPLLRKALVDELESRGLEALQSELQNLDPEHAATIDLQNKARVLRALELLRVSGKPISALRGEKKGLRAQYKVVELLVNPEREVLYRQINQRTESMMAMGWEDEARKLYPMRHLKALQTLGFTEFFNYFEGKYSLDETVALIQQNTRRYAKRQLTWFRNQSQSISIPPDTSVKRMLEIIELAKD